MAHNAYETAEQRQSGRNLHCMSAVVFCAFTIEAYLNHVGVLRLRDWDVVERKLSWRDKLLLISRELKTDFDLNRKPFHAIEEAFAFRDRLAHGKSVIDEEFSGRYTSRDHAEDSYLDPHWLRTFASLKRAKAMLNDMEAVLKQLHAAAGLEGPLGLIAEGEAGGSAEH
jgi:hypothetical protein